MFLVLLITCTFVLEVVQQLAMLTIILKNCTVAKIADNDLENNFENNAEKSQEILNRIMQSIMSIITFALASIRSTPNP